MSGLPLFNILPPSFPSPTLSFTLQAALHTLNVYSAFPNSYPVFDFYFLIDNQRSLDYPVFCLFPVPIFIVASSYLFLRVDSWVDLMSYGFSKMLSSILSCMLFLCMIDSALGHVQMKTPYPLRSPYNTKDTGPKDYDMTSPLSPSGSNYPCKGYNKDISGVAPVETYTAGQSYSITFVPPIKIAIYELQGLL